MGMEKRIENVERDVNKIMTNHLPHLEKGLAVVVTKQNLVLGILAAIGIAVLGQLTLMLFK